MDANTFHPLMHDRGRGPELVGTRITVYNVLHELLDPDVTEHELCRRYELLPHQVAVLRAFVLTHHTEVMEANRRIEERIEREMAAQDTPEFRRQHAESRERMRLMSVWLRERKLNPSLFPDVPGEPPADRRARMFRLFDDWRQQRLAPLTEVG
jgi:uncharacterized protein (DUF433 family)